MGSTETVQRPADLDRLPWRSMVIYDDELRLGHERIPEDTQPWRITPCPPAHLMAHVAALLDYAGRLFRHEGTVMTTRAPGQWESGSPYLYSERELRLMCDEAAAAGWQTRAEQGIKSGWFLFRHRSPARADVYLGILPAIDMREFPFEIVAKGYHSELRGFSAAHLAHQLAAYHGATGAAWRATAGSSGVGAIRNYYDTATPRGQRREQPLWQMTQIAQDWHTAGGELRWHRPLTPSDVGLRYVHTWDMRAARLNAMGMTDKLAWGALDHHTAPIFDGRAGYWRFRLDEVTDSALCPLAGPWWTGEAPPPFDARDVDADGCITATTPLMMHLGNHGYVPEIVDAYLAERSGRYLRGPAERMRDALTMGVSSLHDPEVYDAVKMTYQRTPSMMAHGGMITRHDWHDTILDTERVAVLGGIDRVYARFGVWPVRVVVDELFYASDFADPAAGPGCTTHAGPTPGIGPTLGDGPQLGKWKRHRTFTMAEYLSKYGAE